MANVAYIRVSTAEQNTGRQYEGFTTKGINIDRYFEEKVSGKNMVARPQLKAMLDYIRDENDIVYIESISRLARNTRDFLDIVDKIQSKKAQLVSLKENIDTSTPQGKFMLSVFAALSELEREVTAQRREEGIALAKKEGRLTGRPKVKISSTFAKNYNKWKAEEITAVEFMRLEGLKKTTFYKLVKAYEEEVKAG